MRSRAWLAIASCLLAGAAMASSDTLATPHPAAAPAAEGEVAENAPPIVDRWMLGGRDAPGRAEGELSDDEPDARMARQAHEVERLSERAAAARNARREAMAAAMDEGSMSADGFEIARGGSEAGSGPEITFTIEVEPGAADLSEAVEAIEDALYDERSWAKDHTLVRQDDPGTADIRVMIGSPDTVDDLCAQAGLNTGGRYSCWNGTFAALNASRWENGAEAFDDMTTYRRYLVNHEFGHGLGYGHVGCPEPGALAPVMMQQSISVDDCDPNGWPYPSEGSR